MIPGGFLRDALPFNGFNRPPVISVRAEISNNETTTIRCILKSPEIKNSKSFSPKMAVGVISISIEAASNTKKCYSE